MKLLLDPIPHEILYDVGKILSNRKRMLELFFFLIFIVLFCIGY